MSQAAPETGSRDAAVALLAPALGEEKARQTVEAAATALGLPRGTWTTAQVRSLFAHVAMEAGLVGITARVVARRLRMTTEGTSASSGASGAMPASGLRPTSATLKPLDAIADLLAQPLGPDVAKREVETAARALGYGDPISFTAAMNILERLTAAPGLVGIAAQFAKTRLHLLTW